MVDNEVKTEVAGILLEKYPDANLEMVNYLFKCKVLDVNKCRIAVIKRFYLSLVESGETACNAKRITGERFFRSEKTIENLIYNPFYKDIRI